MSDEPKECTITLDDGTHYDLSSLSSSTDYEADAGEDGVFKLNVCRSVVSELWNVDEPDTVGGFIKREGHGDFSLGKVTSKITTSPSTKQPMLILEDGSKCPTNENERASTAIRFICNPAEFGPGTPKLVAAVPAGQDSCHFFFDWETHVACPTSPARAPLEQAHIITFTSFVVVAFLTWFLGHTLYNRFKLGRRGLAQFPLPQCQAPALSLPSFRRQAVNLEPERPAAPRWGMFKRRSQRAGYNHLRTEPDENDRLAARFSLDDDDYDEDETAPTINQEMNVWRSTDGTPRASQEGQQRETVGAHQGLVDI